jgi:hypothetical protein
MDWEVNPVSRKFILLMKRNTTRTWANCFAQDKSRRVVIVQCLGGTVSRGMRFLPMLIGNTDVFQMHPMTMGLGSAGHHGIRGYLSFFNLVHEISLRDRSDCFRISKETLLHKKPISRHSSLSLQATYGINDCER